jgi:hypothetical protein
MIECYDAPMLTQAPDHFDDPFVTLSARLRFDPLRIVHAAFEAGAEIQSIYRGGATSMSKSRTMVRRSPERTRRLTRSFPRCFP